MSLSTGSGASRSERLEVPPLPGALRGLRHRGREPGFLNFAAIASLKHFLHGGSKFSESGTRHSASSKCATASDLARNAERAASFRR